MAFSLRKMLSNITYFSKPGEGENPDPRSPGRVTATNHRQDRFLSFPTSENVDFDAEENLALCTASINLPESVKNYAVKKGSLSDTDLLNLNDAVDTERRKCRKLKLDIKKASKSMTDSVEYSEDSSVNVENTPKHKLLDCKSADLFKAFNFNQSFDISDAASIASSCDEEMDIESLTEYSDTDISGENDKKTDIRMCRKVDVQSQLEIPSATPESFADVELDKNEEERIALLLNYQIKIEKIECLLEKLLSEFKFHIEVSKIFNSKSIVTALPSTDVTEIPNTLREVTYIDNIHRGISPAGWNIIMEKEDTYAKNKLKNQLFTMKHSIDSFINTYLQDRKPKQMKNSTFDLHKGQHHFKPHNMSHKKKMKHFDFPDLREPLINLFSIQDCDVANSDIEESVSTKCSCHCHSPSDDSESSAKSDKDTPNHSITSSIGNFSLDSTTLSAYSESLDQIVSYNSFNDTNSSLFNIILQKAAIERITFYIQVHSIQLKCEARDSEFEWKKEITFHCPICKITESDENSLIKHILSQSHCEKIHFVYKTAYVKKCISAGKEIQPSTVLNPMTMYRDYNKIVCFGDALYACSLCFENLIIGESILMSHCSEEGHVNQREMLPDIFE